MLEQSTHVANCLEDSLNDGLFTSLIDVLKKEMIVYQELKVFLISEKRMLMNASSLLQLNENNAVKENIILKSRILEEVRTNILKKIARNIDIDEGAIKLMSLANYAVIEKRQIIEKLKNDLLKIARDIHGLNDENKHLLDSSLYNVKGSLDFISSLVDRSGVYLGSGKISEITKNGRLVRTEG
ncbi:MAG: flagellar protein FlgN [Deltaproteobacteria bacterium]